MKLFVLAAAAPLLVASTTLARSPLKRGPTTDTCANLDVDLVFADVELDGRPYNAGHINIGLCISQVEALVGHYNVTEAAIKVVGVDKVESTVVDLIKKAGVQCTYPPHATPSVSSSNECGFVCTNGFLALPANHPSSCLCPSHLKECNGQCGHFHLDCPAAAPPSRRQNDPKCAEGLTMCGVPDATWGQAYKCTDVTSDSYTCGGCVRASPFGGSSTAGVNCHDIPNVDEVCCMESTCVVHTCKSGFTVSASSDGCVANLHARALPAPDADHLRDTVGAPMGLVKGQVDMVGRGSVVDGVSGTDATLGAARQALSAGKADTKVPRGCGVDDDQC